MTFQWFLLKPKMGDYFYKPDGMNLTVRYFSIRCVSFMERTENKKREVLRFFGIKPKNWKFLYQILEEKTKHRKILWSNLRIFFFSQFSLVLALFSFVWRVSLFRSVLETDRNSDWHRSYLHQFWLNSYFCINFQNTYVSFH